MVDQNGQDRRAIESELALAELTDQVTQRLQNGERIDIDELAGHHPGGADCIRRLLPTLRALGKVRLIDRNDANNRKP